MSPGTATVADTLEMVRPHVPPGLVSEAAFSRALGVGSALPARITNVLFLECRLRADDDQVDLVLDVEPPGRQMLARKVVPTEEVHPLWERIHRLCRLWTSPGSRLSEGAVSPWLEFDIDPAVSPEAHRRRAPGVFVSLRAAPLTGERLPSWIATVEDALSPLLNGTLPEATLRGLEACYRGLPGDARIPYVGIMLSRGEPMVRVCVSAAPPWDVWRFVETVGWAGSRSELEALLRHVANRNGVQVHRGPRIVHVDIGERIGTRLGLEYQFDRIAQLSRGTAELPFLEHLVALGLCTEEKRAALVDWPGYSWESMRHEGRRSLVVRRLTHVKVVYESSGAFEVKGYLGYSHQVRARPIEAMTVGGYNNRIRANNE